MQCALRLPAIRRLGVIAAVLASIGLAPGQVGAAQIHTGGKTGSYFSAFGPKLEALLSKSFFDYQVVTSAGSGENIEKVAQNPTDIGLAQGDVLAYRLSEQPDLAQKLTVIRTDVAFECLFAVSGPQYSDRLTNWGEVLTFARRLRIATASENSGPAVTLRFLQTIYDPLQQARIQFMDSTDAAIESVIRSQSDVAFFVQFADPSNPRFERINDNDLHYVPVVGRAMLRQRVGGDQRVYLPQEVKVQSAGILSFSGVKTVTTACTPLAYITGNPELLPAGSTERLDLEEMIQLVRSAELDTLRPDEDWFQSVLDQAVTVTGSGLDSMLDAVDQAVQKIQ